jgi:hypothetical protein
MNATLSAVRVKDKYGYINERGEEVIAPRFDDAWRFANGLAAVKAEGKYGYIDEQGKIVIPPRFARVHNFAANGLAVASVEFDMRAHVRTGAKGKWGYIRAPSK